MICTGKHSRRVVDVGDLVRLKGEYFGMLDGSFYYRHENGVDFRWPEETREFFDCIMKVYKVEKFGEIFLYYLKSSEDFRNRIVSKKLIEPFPESAFELIHD